VVTLAHWMSIAVAVVASILVAAFGQKGIRNPFAVRQSPAALPPFVQKALPVREMSVYQ